MTALPYPANYVVPPGEVEQWCDRLFHLAEELRAGTLSASSPDALARVLAALDALECVQGDLDDTARRAGLAGMLPAVNDVSADPAEVARILREVLDGVRSAPDTTADPLHLAYLDGVAAGLDLAVERCPKANDSGHRSRDSTGEASAQVE